MSSLPLHPVMVHIPLGLAVLLPPLAIGFLWAMWSSRVRPRAWLVIVALQAVLFGAGWIAMNTGEREEDRVEKIVPSGALHAHESFAEQFLQGAGVTLALTAIVPFVRRRNIARGCAIASIIGTVAVAGLAIRVGHAGGELVYTHNAGAAYGSASTGGSTGEVQRPARSGRTRDGDDDH